MVITDPKEVHKLKVAELKEELTHYGLSTAGKKEELVQRVRRRYCRRR